MSGALNCFILCQRSEIHAFMHYAYDGIKLLIQNYQLFKWEVMRAVLLIYVIYKFEFFRSVLWDINVQLQTHWTKKTFLRRGKCYTNPPTNPSYMQRAAIHRGF